MTLEERREHEQAPDAVDDAGDSGQKLDGDADRPLQRPRTDLGQKDGNADADGHGDQHGQGRGHQRAIDGGGGPELVGYRIPDIGDEEAEPEGAERRPRPDSQRDHDADEQRHDQQRRRQGQAAKPGVAAAKAAQQGVAVRGGQLFGQRQVGHGIARTL